MIQAPDNPDIVEGFPNELFLFFSENYISDRKLLPRRFYHLGANL
jgi:hypothetical protein